MLTEHDWQRWADEANEVLAAFSQDGARWWGFGPPCQTFQLVVGDPVGSNVAIMLIGTRYVAGPTMWKNQVLRVQRLSSFSDPNEVSWIVHDSAVAFRAEASLFMWAKNVEVCNPQKWLPWRPMTIAQTELSESS